MSNKTPFELRFDVLELARRHLVEEFYTKAEAARTVLESVGGLHHYVSPEYPTPEAIFSLAERFRRFVDDKPASIVISQAMGLTSAEEYLADIPEDKTILNTQTVEEIVDEIVLHNDQTED